MSEITWILDPTTGGLIVEARSMERASARLGDLLGPGAEVGCARPRVLLPPPVTAGPDSANTPSLRIAGYYHDSLVEGPGRRSSVLVTGCTLGCPGCWVPALHPAEAGTLVPVDRLAEALLDPAYERDGTSILGGEPFQQPEGLLGLVRALRERGCPHILCYSGYTYEALQRRASRHPAIGAILDEIAMLIDGPYVEALATGAGPWTGSANQRVIDLAASRRAGSVIRWDEPTAECPC
ncbi:MAG: 4Fe-4S single cluster domain-containing protein [Solirubrobacteraceae bacterium]